MGIKHAYVTGKPDDPASDVSANEWNADHVITGPLPLAADPVDALDAATKQYVDSKPSGPIVSDTAPVGAANNTLWWSSANGNLYIRFTDQWIQINTVGS